MIGNNFVDEIDCGSFFDHIDDLLDFPVEDVEAGLPPAKGGDSANSFPTIWPTHSESLPGSDSVFSANSNSDLSAELSVPVSIHFKSVHPRVMLSLLFWAGRRFDRAGRKLICYVCIYKFEFFFGKYKFEVDFL